MGEAGTVLLHLQTRPSYIAADCSAHRGELFGPTWQARRVNDPVFKASAKLRLWLWRCAVVVSEVVKASAGYSPGRPGRAFCPWPKGRRCWQCKKKAVVVAFESNARRSSDERLNRGEVDLQSAHFVYPHSTVLHASALHL